MLFRSAHKSYNYYWQYFLLVIIGHDGYRARILAEVIIARCSCIGLVHYTAISTAPRGLSV